MSAGRIDHAHHDLSEAWRLESSYAGTVHWVSEFTGPDRGHGKNRRSVQLSTVVDYLQLDYEEAESLHEWLTIFLSRGGARS